MSLATNGICSVSVRRGSIVRHWPNLQLRDQHPSLPGVARENQRRLIRDIVHPLVGRYCLDLLEQYNGRRLADADGCRQRLPLSCNCYCTTRLFDLIDCRPHSAITMLFSVADEEGSLFSHTFICPRLSFPPFLRLGCHFDTTSVLNFYVSRFL